MSLSDFQLLILGTGYGVLTGQYSVIATLCAGSKGSSKTHNDGTTLHSNRTDGK